MRDADAEPEGPAWRPLVLDRTRDEDEATWRVLVDSGRVRRVRDELGCQLDALVRSRSASDGSPTAPGGSAREGRLDVPPERDGRWVFTPWEGELLHVLGPDDLHELQRRSAGLSAEDARRLGSLTIAVVGPSVGEALARALGGAYAHLKLVDVDPELRPRSPGATDPEVPPAVCAARRILTLDPYARVSVHSGAALDLDALLGGEHPVHVVVDAAEGVEAKLRLRDRARAHRLPFVTAGDRTVEILRFDLEPDGPAAPALVDAVDPRALADAPEPEATLIRWILGARLDPPGASCPVAEDACGADGAFGDAAAAAIRHLVREPSSASSDAERTADDPAAPRPAAAAEARARSALGDIPDHVRFVVAHAAMAPSCGNRQPWRFHWDDERLWVCRDAARSRTLLDGRARAACLAIGAALENLEIAAAHRGWGASVEHTPIAERPDIVAVVHLHDRPTKSPSLFGAIARRATNRRRGPRRPLAGHEALALIEAAAPAATLELCVDDHQLGEVGRILGAAERLRMLCRPLHRELVDEIRWSADEAERTRDGLDLATLELTPLERDLMRVLARADLDAEARRPDRGRVLETLAIDAIAGSSVVGVMSVAGTDDAAWIAGGRAVQRVWLTATRLGLGLQPMCTVLSMLDAAAHTPDLYDDRERAEIASLGARLASVFPASFGRTPIFLVRIAHAPDASARSLRLPLEHILERGTPRRAAQTSSTSSLS